MFLNFKKLQIHNFMSFGDAELKLSDMGYTLINGINQNPIDNAKSNGSGKSAIWEAISWCLTGETIRGMKNNLINIYNGAQECQVTLEFVVDGHCYIVNRFSSVKSSSKLSLIIDGEDKTGKGIRDTEKTLSEHLPELTSELLGSVVILGQGLPQRFTNNTPSGRKEVLEKLSKSDFMIEDIKNKLTSRQIELNKIIRGLDDSILGDKSKVDTLNRQKENQQKRLADIMQESLSISPEKIEELMNTVNELSIQANNLTQGVESFSKELEKKRDYQTILRQQQIEEINKVQQKYLKLESENNNLKYANQMDIKALESRIEQMESISDICPTCGQKIQGVVKPDLTKERAELEELKKISSQYQTDYINIMSQKQLDSDVVQNKYSERLLQVQKDIEKTLKLLEDSKTASKNANNELLNAKTELDKKRTIRDNCLKMIDEAHQLISALDAEINTTANQILYNTNERDSYTKHLDVINKMLTIAKRDFRGFLLTNIIEFIDRKAKEYSADVFDSNKINFNLDGNNISISYNDKPYENLSGGEKQKVDVIIQFALRDMLCKYSSFSSNILVLDELFDGLDALGCQKVVDLITKRLTDIESVFIITHHADIAIPSDTIVSVIKDSNGISTIK